MSELVAGTAQPLESVVKGESPLRSSWRRFSRNKLAVGSMIILMLITLICFVVPLLVPYGPEDADFDNIAAPIDLFSLHPFGTDEFGRDLLLRVLASAHRAG